MVVEHLHDHILIRGRKTKKSEESRDFPGREQIQFGDVVQAPPKLTAPSKRYLQLRMCMMRLVVLWGSINDGIIVPNSNRFVSKSTSKSNRGVFIPVP
ncbi:hypothetical protein NC651_031725 [Populus alba x Populus x berolinensis]|nr:hypothetical protein NC651_031725 [Populus alba x Populus x berolinensis]